MNSSAFSKKRKRRGVNQPLECTVLVLVVVVVVGNSHMNCREKQN